MRPISALALSLGFLSTAVSASRRLEEPQFANRSLTSNVIPGLYLVEFEDGHTHDSFYNDLDAAEISASHRMHLNYSLFQGVSFMITDRSRERQHSSKIAVLPSVKTMWPMRNYTLPSIHRKNTMANPKGTVELDQSQGAQYNDTFSPHAMTQVDRVHAKGYTGSGVRIGIIDTGVDYRHPALGGCFGKDCLVRYGYDLVGDDWSGLDAPKPDDDPYDDCIGHGTHVSGIIAAQPNKMGFTGVATGATLGMYKVFSCYSFGTTDDVLIAAFNMAYEDGSDIITASIGGSGGWGEMPWSTAVGRIVEKGVPCTLAAGNDGTLGVFTPSDAADGKGVTAVASFDNIITPYLAPKAHYTLKAKNASHADIDATAANLPFGWIPNFPQGFSNITLPLMALSNSSDTPAEACSPLPTDTPDLSEHAVLVRLGGCDAVKKVWNLLEFNAVNIIFYADDTSSAIELELYDESGIPQVNGSGTVTAAQGAVWLEALGDGLDVQLTFTTPSSGDTILLQSPNGVTGGFASYYTSWGPTWELDVYPTIAAPGGNILSTYLMNEGGYAVFSGTSMATPFVAGVYALLTEIRKIQRNPRELASIVSTTAKVHGWNDGTGASAAFAPVPQQGAGLVQAYDAAYTTTLLDVKALAFNDSDHFSGSVTFTIENTGDDTITYNIRNAPATGVYVFNDGYDTSATAMFPPPLFLGNAELVFSQITVNLQPKHRATITVTPVPPTGDSGMLTEGRLPVYSGYVHINSSDGGLLTVPYLGIAGSLYDADNLDDTDSWMLECSGLGGGDCTSSPATYTLPYPTSGIDPLNNAGMGFFSYPSADVALGLGSPLVRADVVPLWRNYSGPTTALMHGYRSAGSVWGFPVRYLPRGSVPVIFDGMLADGSVVPEGMYGIMVRVLRLFGDEDDASDYSSLDMIPFMVKYVNSTLPGSRAAGRLAERVRL